MERQDRLPSLPYVPQVELISATPTEFELVPIGAYDGVDLPGAVVLEDSYTVYIEVANPEYNCEVIMG